MLKHVFERGKAIFDDELNYSSEVDLLKSAVLPLSRLKFNRNIRQQIVLRLMINADIDFITEVRKTFDYPPVEKYLTKIEPHVEDIISNSPYID